MVEAQWLLAVVKQKKMLNYQFRNHFGASLKNYPFPLAERVLLMVGRTNIAYRLCWLYAFVPFFDSAPGRLKPSEHPASCGVVKLSDIAPAFTKIITYVFYIILPTGEPSASNIHKKTGEEQ